MPELPDITVYIEALDSRIRGATRERVDVRNPFLLRSVEPPIAAYEVTHTTLHRWTERLRAQTGHAFPEKITASHPEMSVHGRYGEACSNCGTAIQRIRYAETRRDELLPTVPDGRQSARRERPSP